MLLVLTLVTITAGTASTAGATAPGTNGKIAFNRFDVATDTTNCFTIDPDGTREAQIGTGDVGCAAWSPDSSKLLLLDFLEGEGGRPATANPDGTDFTLLDDPNLQLSLGCEFWSPDGTRFLCHSDGNATPADDGFYTLRSSDGGGLQQILSTPPGFADFPFGYSPDGSRILFNRIDRLTDQGALFSVRSSGTDLLRLSPPRLSVVDVDFYDRVSADWSPDGSQVTFAAVWKSSQGHSGRQFALYVVNADGTGLLQVTPSGVGALTAQWSPDGHLIAFSSKRLRRTPPPQVWVVHPDGTGLRELTSGGSTSIAPIWSPDGTELLFQRWQRSGRDLWTVNADGTGLSKLTDIPSDSTSSYDWGSAPVA